MNDMYSLTDRIFKMITIDQINPWWISSYHTKKSNQIKASRKSFARLETNSFTHNLLTGLYATSFNQNGTKDWLEPAKLALHVAGIFYLLTFESFCILKHTAKCG